MIVMGVNCNLSTYQVFKSNTLSFSNVPQNFIHVSRSWCPLGGIHLHGSWRSIAPPAPVEPYWELMGPKQSKSLHWYDVILVQFMNVCAHVGM